MAKKENRYDPEDSGKIDRNDFDSTKNKHDNSQFEDGMSETQEQVSDGYKEGTIDRKKDKED